MPLFLMRPTTENYEITHKRKSWTHKIPTRKNFGPTKYPREKIWDPRNTHEKKFETHEIPTRKYFGPTKYPRQKILDPRNTHEKKFRTNEIPTRKNLGTTKYPREKILDPPNTHEKKFETHEIPTRKYFGPTKYPRRQDGTDGSRPTRPTMACDPRNLAHSTSSRLLITRCSNSGMSCDDISIDQFLFFFLHSGCDYSYFI